MNLQIVSIFVLLCLTNGELVKISGQWFQKTTVMKEDGSRSRVVYNQVDYDEDDRGGNGRGSSSSQQYQRMVNMVQSKTNFSPLDQPRQVLPDPQPQPQIYVPSSRSQDSDFIDPIQTKQLRSQPTNYYSQPIKSPSFYDTQTTYYGQKQQQQAPIQYQKQYQSDAAPKVQQIYTQSSPVSVQPSQQTSQMQTQDRKLIPETKSNVYSGTNSIIGQRNFVDGKYNYLNGNSNVVNNGNYNQIRGESNIVHQGDSNYIGSDGNFVMGTGNVIY